MNAIYYLNCKIITPLCVAILLNGCAAEFDSLDLPKDTSRDLLPTTNTITRRIRCELAKLVMPGVKNTEDFTNYDADVSLSLSVQGDGNLAPSGGYAAGVYSLGVGGKFDYQKTSTLNLDLAYDLSVIAKSVRSQLRANNGSLPSASPYVCPVSVTNLDGDLGLATAAKIGYHTADMSHEAVTDSQHAPFNGSVQFIITKNLNGIGPTWALKQFPTLDVLGSVSQVNTDIVYFGFAPKTKPALLRDSGRPAPVVSNSLKSESSTARGQLNEAFTHNLLLNLNRLQLPLP